MAARRESGTPSAHTLLEVADGLRWTDPALGVSLAEHARRMAGDDDPVIRAAAERSILRSLAEADRYDEVVHRAGPLLDEARQRGDRDDVAAVVVELASAAMGLGDGPTAWTLVDRLQRVDDLPAQVAAAAALVRTRVRAENGDVVGTDGEVERAVAVLLRVPEPEAGLLRREMACARGRARRRAGDPAGALAVLATATTARPDEDPDGGRRSLAAAAEQIEVLVELGRADEARARAGELVPDGPVEPPLVRAVSRIRLAVAEAGGNDLASTRAAAEALEDTGHLDDAARAWQLVAASAESRGDLGEALTALRHGHTLESRARDEHGRSLRRVAAVDVGDLPVADRAPAAPPPELPRDDDVLETVPRRRRHHRDEDPPAEPPPAEVAPVLPEPPLAAEPASVSPPAPGAVDAHGTGLGRQDELADLLAALSRSMEQLPGPALGENGIEPVRAGSTLSEQSPLEQDLQESSPVGSSPVRSDPAGGVPTGPGPLTNGDLRAEAPREWADPAGEREAAAGRRSRHSAPTGGAPSGGDDGPGTSLPPVTRPTFDAFSTAPLHRPEPATDPDPASGRSEPESLPIAALTPELPTPGPVTSDPMPWELPASAALPAEPWEPTGLDDRFTPAPDPRERDRSAAPREDAEPVSSSPAVDAPVSPVGEPTSRPDEPTSVERGQDAGQPSSPSTAADRAEEPRAPRAAARPRPTPRDAAGGERDARGGNGRTEPAESAGARAPRGTNGTSKPDELQEDLGLTLASVLGEYDLPDVPMPPRTDRQRPSANVAVPSARRHTSGSMPVPTEGRREPREGAEEPSAPSAPRPPVAGGRSRPVESGPRLADLLAEAMDAFRHAGPAAQDDARPPGVGSRRA